MQPVAQRDRARDRPRRQALRDNRRLLRRAPAPPTRRSRQNLNPPETVPINWQITWQTSLPASTARDRIIPPPSAPARREQRFAYSSATASVAIGSEPVEAEPAYLLCRAAGPGGSHVLESWRSMPDVCAAATVDATATPVNVANPIRENMLRREITFCLCSFWDISECLPV